MADEENPFNIAIERLPKQLLGDESQNRANTWQEGDVLRPQIKYYPGVADQRQEDDCLLLQNLSVSNTSGDTLVIVRFPAGDFFSCSGHKWETKEFLMESEKLLATGSSVFLRLLSPKSQAQTRRHFNDTYRIHKYILDLTPQIEGDGSASEIVELSLSDGVINWWRSHFVSKVSKSLVSGHDDNCPYHFAELLLEDKNFGSFRQMSDPIDVGKLQPSRLRTILDYCPIRHRAAIIRLLMAISHGDLILNSAPRVVTMAVVAKRFDCVNVVRDHVLTWLMAEPNHNFIEINVEDAFNIAWMLELPAIARVAFQVLVVERAIEDPTKKQIGNINKQRLSLFDRPRGSLTDEQETCIQHAALKQRQRAEDEYKRLMSDDVYAYLGVTEYSLYSLALRIKFRASIHQRVHDAATIKRNDTPINLVLEDNDKNRARFVPAAELVLTRDIYTELRPAQCILTRYFWRSLMDNVRSGYMSSPVNDINFEDEVSCGVSKLRDKWDPPLLDVNIERTGPLVLGLSDEEFKFLPLWAGGFDDGTGGVFQAEIPDAERGVPIGPGPGFYTGESIVDDETSSSSGAPTIYTGEGTVTMTEGYSVQATRSQTVDANHENITDATLAAAVAGLSVVHNPEDNSNIQGDNTRTQNTSTGLDIDRDFDWMADGSEYQDLSDLEGSDYDSDFNSDTDDNAKDVGDANNNNKRH
ncbi:hypothetical protein F5Y03DRAFT_395467 [Xylaria venustula]|nr:hypothetical protein F5Y03DRAFT_395467 [Xylaria venustula]